MHRDHFPWVLPLLFVALGVAGAVLALGVDPPVGTEPRASVGIRPSETPPSAVADGDNVLLAVGDIAVCNRQTDEATAALIDHVPGVVATLGDHVQPYSLRLLRECYAPSWGRHLHRTYPVPGNHDYYDGTGEDYFAYFAASGADDLGDGYYAYEVGEWRVYALNSNCEELTGGCGQGSPQLTWLQNDLEQHPRDCILAYWHHPRFSSGRGQHSDKRVAPFVEALYDAGGDVILSASAHSYQRFAPLTPNGHVDETWGIRHFVVGTGGVNLIQLRRPLVPGTEAATDEVHGVLKLTLKPGRYAWEFLALEDTFSDRGTRTCHGPPP